MKSGVSPLGKVKTKWNFKLAYAIGLIVADGCLSKDGRHIIMTSKDKDQLKTFNKCLGIEVKIGRKFSGAGNLAYYIQFSDVLFYKFLLKIGITPAKSKTISEIKIPKRYFFDYLRGYFDGDGCSFSYFDPLFPKSYRFYISFASGSENYFFWLQERLAEYAGVTGYINRSPRSTNVQLKYAKRDAGIIAKKMYYHEALPCLKRKRNKIESSLERIEKMSRSGGIGRHAAFRAQWA